MSDPLFIQRQNLYKLVVNKIGLAVKILVCMHFVYAFGKSSQGLRRPHNSNVKGL